MKKKIIGILVCLLLMTTTVLASGSSTGTRNLLTGTSKNDTQLENTTLITLSVNSTVIEVNSTDNIVWQKTGLKQPVDAERLSNGNTLITEAGINRIIEVDSAGNIVWQKTGLVYPIAADRLSNGNTLITEYGANQTIEVDIAGNIVWQKIGLMRPMSAQRLSNGNTLITEIVGSRVIEVDSSGNIVWNITGLKEPIDAERLSNGNTLITEHRNKRVIEVDNAGNIIWQKTGLSRPTDADRLSNGNTLITQCASVIEVDNAGNIVWNITGLTIAGPTDAQRVTNQPPNKPTIKGSSSGKIGILQEYIFNAVDPDGNNVEYIINWGDGTSNTTNPNPSGTDVNVSHTWSKKGFYSITAIAKDTTQESELATIKVIMPRSNIYSFFRILFNKFNNLQIVPGSNTPAIPAF